MGSNSAEAILVRIFNSEFFIDDYWTSVGLAGGEKKVYFKTYESGVFYWPKSSSESETRLGGSDSLGLGASFKKNLPQMSRWIKNSD